MDLGAHIEDGRRVKAARIAAHLLRQPAPVTADDAARFTRKQQIAAARGAKTRLPHRETWEVVVEMLAGSHSRRSHCPTCGQGVPGSVPGPPRPFAHDGPCAR